jgi:hypothetical protein
MLSQEFAEGRERMRNAIEEQFRNLDSGGPPSEHHQIPVVPSPSLVTGSETFERPSPARIDLDDGPSRSLAPTAPPPRRQPAQPQRRSRLALIAAGALTATGLAIFLAARLFSRPPPAIDVVPPAREAHREVAPPPSAPAPTIDLTPEKQNREDTRPGPDDTSARPQGRREEVRPKASPPPRGPPGHTNTSPEPPVTTAATPPPPNPDPTPADPAPFRTQQGKPKVQLERDNPWP